jgi:hypothetical protein
MDHHTEKFSLLMDELGPSSASIVLIEQAAPQVWLLALDQFESAISLRLDAETGCVTLSCELGRPQEEERYRIYEALLTYNGLAELHGGIRMALREPNGVVIQEFDIQVQRLDLNLLNQVISDFCKKASAWEQIIESAETTPFDTSMQGPAWDALRA